MQDAKPRTSALPVPLVAGPWVSPKQPPHMAADATLRVISGQVPAHGLFGCLDPAAYLD